MKISNISINKIWTKGTSLLTSKAHDVDLSAIKYKPAQKIKTYAKTSGLRSMQNIKGFEREIIEAYRTELPHEIWGNAEKLGQWASEKASQMAAKNYSSTLLEEDAVKNNRNNMVKEWLNILNNETDTKKNPYLLLKIMKFVIKNLKNDNKALAPVINPFVISQSVHETAKSGLSFEKIYYKNLRNFDTSFDVKTEDVLENNIKGKWYIIKVPYAKDAIQRPGLFSRISNYVSILCQGTNWCTHSAGTVEHSYSGCTFNVFIDNKGAPQICIIHQNKDKETIEAIVGKDQYSTIREPYKRILNSFIEKHKLNIIKTEK